jgi:hypothetical protein
MTRRGNPALQRSISRFPPFDSGMQNFVRGTALRYFPDGIVLAFHKLRRFFSTEPSFKE